MEGRGPRCSQKVAQWHHGSSLQGTLPRLGYPRRSVKPAYTYEHYVSAPDAEDEMGHTYDSVAERVMTEFWVSLPPTTLLNTLHSPEFVEPVY